MFECDLKAFEDVRTCFCLAQFKLRTAIDDIATMVDVATEHFLDVHLLRATVVECEQDHAERALEGSALVELIDDHARDCTTLELDHNTCGLGGLITQVSDAINCLFSNQLGDTHHQRGTIHIVWNRGDDDLLLALGLDDFGDTTCAHDAAPST